MGPHLIDNHQNVQKRILHKMHPHKFKTQFPVSERGERELKISPLLIISPTWNTIKNRDPQNYHRGENESTYITPLLWISPTCIKTSQSRKKTPNRGENESYKSTSPLLWISPTYNCSTNKTKKRRGENHHTYHHSPFISIAIRPYYTLRRHVKNVTFIKMRDLLNS